MSEQIAKQLHEAIVAKLPGSIVEVTDSGGGHYSLDVTSDAFAGQKPLAKQRLVLSAIAHLMGADGAPVHAIDRLSTNLPRD